MVWGKNGGPKKKFFEKKSFFPATYLPLSQHQYRRHQGSKTTAQTRRSYLIPFRSYGGPKILAKKILTPLSENLVDRFR
jgi:hypothetical protein